MLAIFKNHGCCLLLACLLLGSFQGNAQADDPAAASQQVTERIQSLPEVKAMDNVFDSISNRRQRVRMRVFPPEGARELYKVEVGYQGSNRFEPHFYFYVSPDGDQIWVEDLEYGDRPTLQIWRQRRQSGQPPAGEETDDTTLLPKQPESELIYDR